MYKRDEVLLAIGQGILEITLKEKNFETGKPIVLKGTLMSSHIPPIATEPAQQDRIRDFHVQNPNFVAYWDVENKRWSFFDVNDVVFCQESPTV